MIVLIAVMSLQQIQASHIPVDRRDIFDINQLSLQDLVEVSCHIQVIYICIFDFRVRILNCYIYDFLPIAN